MKIQLQDFLKISGTWKIVMHFDKPHFNRHYSNINYLKFPWWSQSWQWTYTITHLKIQTCLHKRWVEFFKIDITGGWKKLSPLAPYFSPLLCAVSACNTLFAKKNTLFSVKTFKTTCRLGWWSVPNVQNLEKLGIKIHKYILLLDFPVLFCNTACMPSFSIISPGLLQKLGGINFGRWF